MKRKRSRARVGVAENARIRRRERYLLNRDHEIALRLEVYEANKELVLAVRALRRVAWRSLGRSERLARIKKKYGDGGGLGG